MFPSQQPKVGLALGSGAARGFAHIGVIKVLEKYGIKIEYISGSSIGALIGGIYAMTKDISYVEDLALNMNWPEMIKMADPAFGSGVIAGDKVEKYIRTCVKHKKFSDTQIPFTAVATDLRSGERVVFREGDLGKAIRASISMPFVFHATKHGDQILCDGVLSNPIPAALVREMGAEYVIAIDLDSQYFKQNRKDTGENLGETGYDIVMLLSVHLSRENMKDADFVLSPHVGDIHWSSFFSKEKTVEIIRRGEAAMEEAMPKILDARKPKTLAVRFAEFFRQL
jgi:NTE family protein